MWIEVKTNCDVFHDFNQYSVMMALNFLEVDGCMLLLACLVLHNCLERSGSVNEW